jgi:hypothetical protein
MRVHRIASYLDDRKRNIFRHPHPQGEAIHTGTPDGFASYLATPRKDGAAGRLHKSPYSLFALLKYSVSFPITTQELHFATI